MTDDPNDPWRYLADQLGVQPGEEPVSPPPSSVPSPPAAKHAQPPTSPPPAPAKKSKSDWNALAGELGLEVPPEPETKPSAHDPVAELLGFPPPSARPPQREEVENRGPDESSSAAGYGDQRDRFSNRAGRQDEEDQPRSRDLYDDTQPVYDDPQPTDLNEREQGGGFRDRPPAGEEKSFRPGRRRGGRGRGRGRGERSGEGLGNRYGNQHRERREYDNRQHDDTVRPPAESEPQADHAFDEDVGDDRPFTGESTAESAGENQQRARDDQSHPRRRRRRGRGGSRDRDQQRPRDDRAESDQPAAEEIPFLEMAPDDELTDAGDVDLVDFTEVDFTAADYAASDYHASDAHLADEHSEHGEEIPAESAGPSTEIDEHDEADLAEGDENHSGKTSVRDILTWKEAIGMIVEGNMQTRAHTPHNSQQHSRGPRGRGRGRGRGGHRR